MEKYDGRSNYLKTNHGPSCLTNYVRLQDVMLPYASDAMQLYLVDRFWILSYTMVMKYGRESFVYISNLMKLMILITILRDSIQLMAKSI